MRDLEPLCAFLHPEKSVAVRERGRHPRISRPDREMPEYRELLVDFGDSGYVALYRHAGDQVTALALRHQREAGYRA